ncbi:MAG: pyrroline-5-carboxylate reductase [Clostridia bacterium]|nr:pyrroline-5-carboxylate reductase [Clostridia bacterium]
MKKIGFIGAGNMGGAIIKAVCAENDPREVVITGLSLEKARAFAAPLGCGVAESNTEVAREAEIVVLGVKPQVVPGVMAEIAPVLAECVRDGKPKLLVSIAAGLTTQTLRAYVPGADVPVIRMMPNMPAAIGEGMILVAADQGGATQEQYAELMHLLRAAGRFDLLPEKLIDAATVPAGCAPAYAAMFIEALADGAVMAGVPRAKAYLYAAQAVKGAAAMLLESGMHPGALKDAVCSPGGSTIAGAAELERGGLRGTVIDAVLAACARNAELGKQK